MRAGSREQGAGGGERGAGAGSAPVAASTTELDAEYWLSLVIENPQGQKGGVFCVADPDRCDGTSRRELHDSIERIDPPQWTDIERQSDDRHIGEGGNRSG